QENSLIFRYELEEDTFDNILEHNFDPIVLYEFSLLLHSFEYFISSNLKYFILLSYIFDSIFTIPLESSSCNYEYIVSSFNLEYVDSSSNLEYFISLM
ncbi:18728_t:CDS:1, partial [Gigaspora margarita]